MPRNGTDWLQVVPEDATNFAFNGHAKSTRGTIFTSEYSVRAAMEAARQLANVDRGVKGMPLNRREQSPRLEPTRQSSDPHRSEKAPSKTLGAPFIRIC